MRRHVLLQGGLHASVTQAAASLPGSPAWAAAGSRPASPVAPTAARRLDDSAHDSLLSSNGATTAWAQALYDECPSPLQQQQPNPAASPRKGKAPGFTDPTARGFGTLKSHARQRDV